MAPTRSEYNSCFLHKPAFIWVRTSGYYTECPQCKYEAASSTLSDIETIVEALYGALSESSPASMYAKGAELLAEHVLERLYSLPSSFPVPVPSTTSEVDVDDVYEVEDTVDDKIVYEHSKVPKILDCPPVLARTPDLPDLPLTEMYKTYHRTYFVGRSNLAFRAFARRFATAGIAPVNWIHVPHMRALRGVALDKDCTLVAMDTQMFTTTENSEELVRLALRCSVPLRSIAFDRDQFAESGVGRSFVCGASSEWRTRTCSMLGLTPGTGAVINVHDTTLFDLVDLAPYDRIYIEARAYPVEYPFMRKLQKRTKRPLTDYVRTV